MKSVFAAIVLLFSQAALAQKVPIVTTIAGGFINDGKPATDAALNFPSYAARDFKGNLYISDSGNNRIRKVDSTGVITTIAGNGIAGYGGDGGPATSAVLNDPEGIVVDSKGNIFFADSVNSRVRKIDTKGIITTVAGNGTIAWNGDNGPATAAGVGYPWGLAFNKAHNLYISQISGNVVREVDSSGIIHTVAGNGLTGNGGFGDGGPATSAELNFPEAIVFDRNGYLYIADTYENRVRRVDTGGTITTAVGNGKIGCSSGDGGLATSATITFPSGLTIQKGKLVISQTHLPCGNSIWAVNLSSNIIKAIGGPSSGFNGDGLPPLSTEFFNPQGVTTDKSADLLVVDSWNGRIRKIASGTVQTIAGGGYLGDGAAAVKSSLNGPVGIAFDSADNLYIADDYNNRVRQVSPPVVITTFAGNEFSGSSGDGGLATSATLTPWSVAADLNGNVFIADSVGGVRKVDTNGMITHLGGPSYPIGLSTDSLGNVYASSNPVVWKITPAGTATIIAGVANQYGYNGDGIPATQAYLSGPDGMAMDALGNLYIVEGGNNRIRKVDTSGIISTVAGNGTYGFSGDGGVATNAELAGPTSIALDQTGNLYIADTSNYRIRIVNSSGIIQTFAGTGNRGYNGNALPALLTNMFPLSIAVNSNGVVYFTDGDSGRIREIQ